MTGRLTVSSDANKKSLALNAMETAWLKIDPDFLAAQAKVSSAQKELATATATEQQKAQADALAEAKAKAQAQTLADAQAVTPTPPTESTPEADASPQSSPSDGYSGGSGTYVGPRGGVYHYSANGNKVYSSHGGGHGGGGHR